MDTSTTQPHEDQNPQQADHPSPLRPPPSPDAVVTYQTLRVGMVGTVVMLAAAILTEALGQGWQFESSISAYWYTPVRPVFVAALVAIGVALIVIKGTAWEDTWLNFAGIFAPLVAFVPTTLPGQANLTAPVVLEHVANSMIALFSVGFLGLASALVLRRPSGGALLAQWRSRFWGSAAIYLVTVISFFAFRETFTARAHHVAAAFMFLCLAATVCVHERRDTALLRRAYVAIASLMVATIMIAWGVLVVGTTWVHFILVVELIEIALFTAFWLLQTWEYRDEVRQAVREVVAGAEGRATPMTTDAGNEATTEVRHSQQYLGDPPYRREDVVPQSTVRDGAGAGAEEAAR